MEHYNRGYFDWQKNLGAFGGMADLFKFQHFINKNDKIIDFGAGGGYLLSNIDCQEKVGVEINEAARNEAEKLGVKMVEDIDMLEDNWADIIISNHALEHVESPLQALRKLFLKLKSSGKIVFVVPFEKKNSFKPGDINFHLYTWSEMNLGNLFVCAGFAVLEVKELKHRWPPKFLQIRKLLGQSGFDVVCQIYGTLNNNLSQIRIIAEKQRKDH